MNDVSILMPLPTDVPVLMGLFDQAVPLADPIWFDTMVFTRRPRLERARLLQRPSSPCASICAITNPVVLPR
jgi:hypothetical protein